MKRFLILLLLSAQVLSAATPESMEADLKAHPEHLSTRIQLANFYTKKSNFDKVITLLNSYTDQLTSQGFLALANAYSNKKDYLNEVRVLNVLAIKEPEDFHWHILLGQAYLKQSGTTQDPEKKKELSYSAVQNFRKALQLSPKYKPAYDILLNTLMQQKAHNESRELLMEGITKFGERPELYRELCRLDAMDGFLDSAVKNCRAAIKLAPTYPDNHVFLIQALFDQKEEQMAENDAVAAARRFPNSEFVQWAAGTLFFKKKNYPVSARYFSAAVKADPKSSRAQFGLAQSQFESGEELASLEHFVKACEGDVTTIDTFLAAGGKLKQRDKYKLGEEFVSKANTCKKN